MDDAGEIHALGGSLRREASSARSGDAAVFFSRSSSRDEDDEEALRWAALEKLPTYDRARTAVLAMPEGELREVNVQRLGPQERHALLQRLAWVGDDHARFLSKFKDRVDRYQIRIFLFFFFKFRPPQFSLEFRRRKNYFQKFEKVLSRDSKLVSHHDKCRVILMVLD
jgi:hypothetical protein